MVEGEKGERKETEREGEDKKLRRTVGEGGE